MLKKLVKYGNSSALVLDKPLLELLNIAEGSVLKIKTDGISLIITPQHVEARENIMPTIIPQETFQDAVQKNMTKHVRNPEDVNVYMNKLREVFVRYAQSMKKLETPEVQQAFQELEKSFEKNKRDPEYSRAAAALRHHYAPELVQMEQEIQALSQKHAPVEYQLSDDKTDKLGMMMEEFKKVHEKYRHLFDPIAKLHENTDYINESVFLAEKYHAVQNSTEYIKEYAELIAKYIPEYSVYQAELKAVAELLK